jgi:hypothetical protein
MWRCTAAAEETVAMKIWVLMRPGIVVSERRRRLVEGVRLLLKRRGYSTSTAG